MKKSFFICFLLLLCGLGWADDVAYLTLPGRDFSHGNTLGVPLLSFQVSNANTHSRTIRPHVTVTFPTEKGGLAKFCMRNGGVFRHMLISRYHQVQGGQPQWFETYRFQTVAIASVSYFPTKARVQFNFQTMAYKEKPVPAAPVPTSTPLAVTPTVGTPGAIPLKVTPTTSIPPVPQGTATPSQTPAEIAKAVSTPVLTPTSQVNPSHPKFP